MCTFRAICLLTLIGLRVGHFDPLQVFPRQLKSEWRFFDEILAIPRLKHKTFGQLSNFGICP